MGKGEEKERLGQRLAEEKVRSVRQVSRQRALSSKFMGKSREKTGCGVEGGKCFEEEH